MVVRKSKGPDKLVQTGLRLEPGILERLRAGRGISEEVRDRLQRTFAEDELDAVTRELRDGIINIVKLLGHDFGAEWHTSPAAHEALAAALAQRIAAYAPAPGAPVDAAVEMPGDPPDIIGRMRERDDRRAHAYRHLTAALKAKSGATD
jgi:hypothetical protein